jgi:hypothetical protein
MVSIMSYNLNSIPQIHSLLTDNDNRADIAKSLNLKINSWRHKHGGNYNILKYNKDWLSKELVTSVGLLRSLIYKNDGTIVCFSPPKSLPTDNLKIDNTLNFVAEEFIEGTMINVFYDNEISQWEIATKSGIGGQSCFFMENGFKKENTFKYMFDEVCNKIGFDLNALNKAFIYSFVIQHPRNRIVKIIQDMQLYLVQVYEVIDNKTIKLITIDESSSLLGLPSTIKYPSKNQISNNDELNNYIAQMASSNTPYHVVGIMVKNNLGERYKFRNPNYEHVRHLRGNQPKLQFHYLYLRKSGQVGEYLQYYKEHKEVFQGFRNLIHDYTSELFNNYIRCYIKKEKELLEFPEKFRTHMYGLHHDLYLKELRPNNRYINKTEVIQYFNNLPSAKQMFIVNYDVRKQFKDEQNIQ